MKINYVDDVPEAWQPTARVFSALGEPLRQKILLLFETGEELSIRELAKVFPVSRTTIVHHLSVLERANILQVRRQGKEALYSVRPEPVLEALDALRTYILEEFPQGDS